jgi:hypothetical protein
MPTMNPRVAITLPPYRHALLKRMAKLQGVSMSSMVSNLLDEFYPVLERVCVALEMAQKAQESSRDGLRRAADKALEEIQPLLAASMQQFDMFMQTISVGGDDRSNGGDPTKRSSSSPGGVKMEKTGRKTAGKNRLAKGESGGLDPRIVTRGSEYQEHRPNKRVKPSTAKGLRS